MTGIALQEKKRPLLWRLGRTPKPQRQAVIDIGSNSVRLIVYQINGRSIIPRVNEKVMAGLGAGLSETGRLPEKGVLSALGALKRFQAICSSLGVTDIRAIATAAVRDAKDGPDFCRTVKDVAGIHIEALSGLEEAKYAALGVVAAQRDPTGLIGDLGGSSLELIEVDKGKLSTGKTYKIGPLAIAEKARTDHNGLVDHIRSILEAQGPIPQTDRFFAVGGAWRAFARIYMHKINYPLHVLQSYQIPAKEAISLADQLLDQKSKWQSLAKSVAGKRYATLELTSLVLQQVLKASRAKSLVISAYGVREGLVFSEMSDDIKRLDPLLAGVTTLANPDIGQAGFSRSLNDFLRLVLATQSPVFVDASEQEERLITAAFILADIGATMHPDHRADIARQIVLRGPYTGIEHDGRVFLGLITAFRYNRKFEPTDLELATLSEDQIERARLIAHLIRVAAEFSCRTERILKRGKLSIEDDHLVLTVAEGHDDLVSESVEKRLSQAASLMKLNYRID